MDLTLIVRVARQVDEGRIAWGWLCWLGRTVLDDDDAVVFLGRHFPGEVRENGDGVALVLHNRDDAHREEVHAHVFDEHGSAAHGTAPGRMEGAFIEGEVSVGVKALYVPAL